MKLKQGQKGSFDLTTSIAIFLVCLIISLAVAAFHYWYFPSKYIEYKSHEVQKLLNTESDFSEIAKNILNTRNDIAYLKLLNQNGVLEESFGGQSNVNVKKFNLNAPDNKTIVVGIKNLATNRIDGYALLWSLIIGSSISILLLFIIFLVTPTPNRTTEKLSEALKKAVRGDYSARLNIDSSVKGDDEMVEIFSNFNSIMDVLSSNGDNFHSSADGTEVDDDFSIGLSRQERLDEDDVIVDDLLDEGDDEIGSADEIDLSGIETADSEKDKLQDEEISREPTLYKEEQMPDHEANDDIDDPGKGDDDITDQDIPDTTSPFKPKVISMGEGNTHVKHRNVTVLVAKISEFDSLVNDLEPSDLNSFISEYRKTASSIVADYGGVIEALLQDEIVAIFNAPEKQDHPELRSVSASVEIMQLIADLAKKRKAEGKRIITGKIGLSVSSIPFYSESGIPDKVKDVVEHAKLVCNNTNKWKIYLTGDLYDCVKDHVDVKQTKVNGNFYFSVTGVEEGVLRI